MKNLNIILTAALLACVLFAGTASASTKGIFIDLSSPDVFKVHRAFAVGTMLRKQQNMPVTLFISLNVTPYAGKDYPISQMLSLRGENIHDHMNKFMAAGGKIMVCGMCLGGHGMDASKLLPGITVGMPGKLIADEDIKLISY
jgi:predicted peroxiredoxin